MIKYYIFNINYYIYIYIYIIITFRLYICVTVENKAYRDNYTNFKASPNKLYK